MPDNETYIGDGVYASFDGYQIQLRAPRGSRDENVFLEPSVYRELMAFGEKCWPSSDVGGKNAATD